MIFSPLMSFLRIRTLPLPAQRLVQKFFFLASLQSILFMISSTFYVLFVIDQVGYEALGVLLAMSFIVQAVLDYPTGVLGDWVGQRFILALSFIAYGLSYGLLALADSFTGLLVVYVLAAFARAQESGALQSWFDNNYKVAADAVDPKRETYQVFQGKFNTLFGLIGGAAFVCGATIATMLYRNIVFALQSFGMFIVAGLCLILVKNLPDIPKPEISVKNYFRLLGEGVRFSLGSKYMLFFVANTCIAVSLFVVWVEMVLFPMYYGYTGSDLGVALLRFTIWTINSLTALKAGDWSKRLNARKWIPRMEFISTVPFFGFFALFIFLFPLENRLNLMAISFVILFFFIWYLFMNTYFVMRQRLMLDMIPDANRNSVYSLLPTLNLIVGAPFVWIAGNIIETFGIPFTLALWMIIGGFGAIFLFFSIHFLPKEVLSEEEKKNSS